MAGSRPSSTHLRAVSAEMLNGMSPDKQFMALADAFDQVSNSSDKVQYAMDIFGRGGVELVNTMRGGSDALEAFADEADRLGSTGRRSG